MENEFLIYHTFIQGRKVRNLFFENHSIPNIFEIFSVYQQLYLISIVSQLNVWIFENFVTIYMFSEIQGDVSWEIW